MFICACGRYMEPKPGQHTCPDCGRIYTNDERGIRLAGRVQGDGGIE